MKACLAALFALLYLLSTPVVGVYDENKKEKNVVGDRLIAGQYVVRFNPTFKASPLLKAIQLIRGLNGPFGLRNLLHVYSDSIIGFAVKGIDNLQATAILADENVLSVTQVRGKLAVIGEG